MLDDQSQQLKPNPPRGTGAADFMSAVELADWLHVSLRTIRNWERRRVVPYLKVGRVVRFRRAEVEEALAGLTLAAIAGGRLARRKTL